MIYLLVSLSLLVHAHSFQQCRSSPLKYVYVTIPPSQRREILDERLVNDRLPLLRDNMKLLALVALAAVANCEFTCITRA